MKFRICLDDRAFSIKPTDNETRGISYRLPKNEVDLTLDEIAEVTIQGKSFTTSTFGGKTKKKANWVGPQYLFGKDFDRNTPPEVIYKKAQELGLGFGFAYTTFSDTPEYRKLRFVFYIEEPIITTSKRAEAILKALDTFFGDSDISCKNADRIWYGGKERVFSDRPQEPISTDALIQLLELASVIESDANNKARNLKKVQSKNEYLRDLLDQTTADSKFLGCNLPEMIRNVDIEADLVPKLKIMQSIKAGGFIEPVGCYEQGERLHRPHIWGLAMNLRYIQGGLAWLEEQMDKDDRYEDYHYDILAVTGYHPTRLTTFSPFKSDHFVHNILHATGRKEYAITEDPTFLRSKLVYTVDAARQYLEKKWWEFIYAKNNKVYVFKCITGLGKTKLIADLLIKGFVGYTISSETHDLKDELCDLAGIKTAEEFAREKIAGINSKNVTYVNPKLPASLPEEIRAKLDYYYSTGAEKAAEDVLKDYIKFLKSAGESTLEVESYYRAKQAVHGCTFGNILTTHSNVFSKDKKGNFLYGHNDVLIFDEDPLNNIVNTFSVTLQDFKTLRGHAKSKELEMICDHYIDYIENKPSILMAKEEFTSPFVSDEIISLIVEGQKGKLYSSNIGQFLTGDVAYYSSHASKWNKPNEKDHIVFVIRKELPADRTIGIFSATADEKIYKMLLGDRLEFIDITSVLCEGKLVQDTEYSCSRAFFSKDDDGENESKKLVDKRNELVAKVNKLGKPVITFKSYQNYFKNSMDDIYIGKSSGTDKFNGKSLIIVASPHIPYTSYILFAKALGLDVKSFLNHKPVMRRITRNGFTFPLMTFERDELVNIQCYFIERELYQPVGRPRPLSNAVMVYLFSNYPLRFYSKQDERVMMECQIVMSDESDTASALDDIEVLF